MLGKTIFHGDEELAKRDDDHRFVPARRSIRSVANHSFRWRRRRLLLVVVALLVIYVLFGRTGGGIGGAHDTSQSSWTRPIFPSANHPRYRDDNEEPIGPPPGTPRVKHEVGAPHIYDGQVRFFRLASTLRASASHFGGYDRTNRNVLFVMSSLRSASTLLPVICDMSKWRRNHVHAAFMGREDIPLGDLLDINGIDKTKCPATWHDARPDYTEYSTDTRAESAVTGAMSHINSFLHPQAVIMDDSLSEDAPFVRGMRSKTSSLGTTLIELPKDRSEDLGWMTRLDAGSLRHWHTPTVDILIQVPPSSSNVLRLLKSIREADYSGLKPPRITLELPADLDESVKQHIDTFQWPPHHDNPTAVSGLIIRRRIMNHRASQEDEAMRCLELFYPTSISNSHALIVSAQAQLSPQYFHFVTHVLLEYRYSAFGAADHGHLMGVSLELPDVLLDGKTKLARPMLTDMHTDRYMELYPDTASAPFLWQAPNSHATLFFGNKWAELRSFLQYRLTKHQRSTRSLSRAKSVSETLPSWTEYMLELMRARGYSLLYPAFMPNAMVTVHNELYHAPEEFSLASLDADKELGAAPPDLEGPFLRSNEPLQKPRNVERPVVPGSMPLHAAMPFDGDLPEVPHMPHLLYDGTKIDPSMVTISAAEYANDFRKEIGGCTIPEDKHRKVVADEARDLFCFGDEDADEWIGDEIDAPDASIDDALQVSSSVASLVSSTRNTAFAHPTVKADGVGYSRFNM